MKQPCLDRLKAFLYHLIRDELPTGTVFRLIENLPARHEFESIEYTSMALENYAQELMQRLLDTD